MFLSLCAQHLAQGLLGLRGRSLDDEVRLARNGIMAVGCPSVTIALWEAVHRHAAQQELVEHAILDVVHPARANALRVVVVMAVELLALVFGKTGVAEYAEIGWQHILTDHVAEGLTARLEAVGLQAVTENLMEEHTAGGA